MMAGRDTFEPHHYHWKEAKSLEAALEAGAQPGTLFKAGGLDLFDRLRERLETPLTIVNLRNLAELDFVRFGESEGITSLGPLVTIQRLAGDLRLPKALRKAALLLGTAEVRARATLGGNLAQRTRCWYFRNQRFHCARKGGAGCDALAGQHEAHAVFDNDVCASVHPSSIATALVALRATVKLRSLRGARDLPLEEFFVSPRANPLRENVLQPGELIVSIDLPVWSVSSYGKLVFPGSFDWTIAEAAVALQLDGDRVLDASVVLGAAAPTPHRARGAEEVLRGQRLVDQAARAARVALEGATPLPRNQVKLAQLELVVLRALQAAAEEARK